MHDPLNDKYLKLIHQITTDLATSADGVAMHDPEKYQFNDKEVWEEEKHEKRRTTNKGPLRHQSWLSIFFLYLL